MTGSLLVIAPHPDDEILGAAAIMARARAQGEAIAVIILTDGSRSDPDADPRSLAARRREETEAGLVALLGTAPPLLFFDQPDGLLDSRTPVLDVGPLAAMVAEMQPSTILVTDPADGHPDHKAAFGLATRLISAGWGQKLEVMPIGQRVDGVFDRQACQAVPVAPFEARKSAAIMCHASQLEGRGFSLSEHVLADFNRREYLRLAYDRNDTSVDAIAAEHFDDMFEASPDPWRYDDEPYERDRFARTVAALDDRHYRSALELGCANGALTEQLAPLCDALLATDASRPAIEVARKRLAHLSNVSTAVAALPDAVPQGPFDLIVASDMLYYLGLEGVIETMAKLERQAAPICRMLIASYLGETDTRLTGEMSSETAIAHLAGWQRIHAQRTDKLRIDVLERRPA